MSRPYLLELCGRAVWLARLHEKPTIGITADLGIAQSAPHHRLRQDSIDEGQKEDPATTER